MSIFQKVTGSTDYFDQITIGGYSFEVSVTVQQRRGNPLAIRCGRITCFQMMCEDELVAYFDDGQWYIAPDRNSFDGDFDEATALAIDLMVQKWSNPEKIRNKIYKTDLF